jgi:hypothetical protein
MQQNTTLPTPPELEPKQARALEQLLVGATVSRAAEAAGVDRSTVHRWLRHDFDFLAAYNGAQRDLRREAENRLLRLMNAATEAVVSAVEAGDVRVALAVLKGLGMLPGSPPAFGGDDPKELAEDAELTEQKKASDRAFQRLGVLSGSFAANS